MRPRWRFDPRPCGRGDVTSPSLRMSSAIVSIHAPAGGATREAGAHSSSSSVSIHAPAGGATRVPPLLRITSTRFRSTPLREGRPSTVGATAERSLFRSTPLREGRQASINDLSEPTAVSIHAPAGGATIRPWLTFPCTGRFDPRPCGRGDCPVVQGSFGYGNSCRSASLTEIRGDAPAFWPVALVFAHNVKELASARTSWGNAARLWFAPSSQR